MATVIEFTVYGVPQARGSKRAFPFRRKNGKLGVAVSDNNPNSKDWMASIRDAAVAQFGERELLRGPLSLTLSFSFPRPKGHFGTGRNAGIVKQSAPVLPAGRPDLLKTARAVEDALSGVIYADDAQIVYERLTKCYSEPARVEISIVELTPTNTGSE